MIYRLALLVVMAVSPLFCETVFDWDAGSTGTWTELHGERVSGSVPPGWEDNSAWAKVRVVHSRITEDGTTWWRIGFERREEGRPQAAHPIGPLASDSVWRLTLRIRSRYQTALQVGLRDRGAPYAWAWDVRPEATPLWRTLTYTSRLPAHPADVDLLLGVDSLGEVDVAAVRLERWGVGEFAALIGQEQPGNLLRVTRAPLGLPPGWSLNAPDGDVDASVQADAQMEGPGGGPALRWNAPHEAGLWCGTFTAKAAARHVASVWLRGAASGATKGWLRVQAEGQLIGRVPYSITPEEGWRRFEVPFAWQPGCGTYAVHLLATGSLWVDALQVEAGATASAFHPAQPCELALGTDGEVAYGFTAAVQVRWRVLGELPAGAVMSASATDAYGITVVRRIPATASGAFTWDPFPERPLGPVRIEALLEDRNGTPISPSAELIAYRLPRPRHAGEDAPDSPFGVHVSSTARDLAAVTAIGCTWARLHDVGWPDQATAWSAREPKPGEWQFADAAIQRYRDHHLLLLGMLSTAPGWASHLGRNSTNYFDGYYQPKDLAAWSAYCRTVVARHRSTISAWEVWNEPWMPAFWHIGWDQGKHTWIRSPQAGADYAQITALARDAAHAAAPESIVLGFNTASAHTAWTREVAAAGGIDGCDVVSYHHYESSPLGSPGDRMHQGWDEAVGPLVVDGKVPRPVWLSEGSPLMRRGGKGLYRLTGSGMPDEDVLAHADVTARWMVGLLTCGVQRFFIYSTHCHTYFTSTPEALALFGQDGALHPTASAYAACAWNLEGCVFSRYETLADGVSGAVFTHRRGPGQVMVVLPAPGHSPWRVPPGAIATDVLGNPVKEGTSIGDQIIYLSATSP